MIHSMTAFGSARIESGQGSLAVEFRTVNSRFLDISIRMPDELRVMETQVREQINRYVTRGKVDVRLSYVRHTDTTSSELDIVQLEHLAKQLALARQLIPDIVAPRLLDLLSNQADRGNASLDIEVWSQMCAQACQQALDQLTEA